MKDIKELYEMGDFDAIRQMWVKEEAAAEEKARAERAQEIAEARNKVIAATKAYMDVLGFEYSDAEVNKLLKAMAITEKVAQKGSGYKENTFKPTCLSKFAHDYNKPIVISTTGELDDEILQMFLKREI